MTEDTAPSSPLPAGPGARRADEVLNALLLDLAHDVEIAPYLHYIAGPLQLVPAEKTIGYIERIIAAFRRAKGET